MTEWFAKNWYLLAGISGAAAVIAFKMHRTPTRGSYVRRVLVAIWPALDRQQQTPSKAEIVLWTLGVVLVPTLITYGTLNPWSEAVAKLEPIGQGPYVPYAAWWSSSTVGDKTKVERGQMYVVPSRMLDSSSTYEVREVNSVVAVEEVKFGLFYLAGLALMFVGGIAWEVRRLSHGKHGA